MKTNWNNERDYDARTDWIIVLVIFVMALVSAVYGLVLAHLI